MGNKLLAGILGLAIGDAVGLPYQFMMRDTFECRAMTGHGAFNKPPGTISDDTSLTLATMESIGRVGYVDLKDIQQNFMKWYYDGAFTPENQAFDIGSTTSDAINRMYIGCGPDTCGGTSEADNGNGALMRILPMAFYCKDPWDPVIKQVAGLTHNHKISQACCWIYVYLAQALAGGIPLDLAIEQIPSYTSVLYDDTWGDVEKIMEYPKPREEVKSTGYVVDTLDAALWALRSTDNYRDCILVAVNLGDDTDTVAAVAGGLAGIMYGFDKDYGIPWTWIRHLRYREKIMDIYLRFEGAIGNVK